MKKLESSINDLLSAIKKHRVWVFLGQMDVKQRYRRSLFGPWWISLSMLIFIFSMSAVFSRIFQQGLKDYVPFFTAGFLVWQLISSCINEAPEIFRSNNSYVKHTNLPFNLYVLKYLTRQLSIFLHNFVVYLLVIIVFRVELGWKCLFVVPGLFLLIVNLYWVSLLVGLLGTRFRDTVPIITNCMQIAFFVTPISWMPKLLSPNSLILLFNPLVYYIDIVRSPLLNIAPSLLSWMVTGAITVVGLSLSLFVFSSYRHRIVFWVD